MPPSALDRDLVRVVNAGECLDLHVESADQPVSVALWRNLRGWPEHARTAASASNRCSAVRSTATRGTPSPSFPDGTVRWRLTITAHVEGNP